MWTRMTSFAKLVAIIALMSLVGAGLYFSGMFKPGDKKSTSKSTETSTSKSGGISSLFDSNDELTVIVNTWGGFVPLAYLNGGSKTPNPESRISKEFGIDLTISVNDNFADSRSTFVAGKADLVYCTADVFPTEMGVKSAMAELNAQIIGQVDWSRGGDMIVALNSIKTVADLKGKKIAVAEKSASHSLLIKVLETNGLTMADVIPVWEADGIAAAAEFKTGNVPVAVVWTPDGEDIVEGDFKGKAKILVSTDKAPFIIADCMVATEQTINEKKDVLVRFMTAWLTVNGELNSASEALKTKAAEDFAKVYGMGDSFFGLNGLNKVRLTTLGDNYNFFEMNPNYLGVTGDQLYTRMSRVYGVSNPKPWRSVHTTAIIEAIQLTGASQEAEAAIKFTAATAETKTKAAISSKKVSINFPTGSYTLTDEAKEILNSEIAPLAKDFAGYRMRVEGNTDAVGNSQMNLELSFKRAQAVVNYLVTEYQFDTNRFIVQGNGSKQATAAGVTSASENYRRTDFQFVEE